MCSRVSRDSSTFFSLLVNVPSPEDRTSAIVRSASKTQTSCAFASEKLSKGDVACLYAPKSVFQETTTRYNFVHENKKTRKRDERKKREREKERQRIIII